MNDFSLQAIVEDIKQLAIALAWSEQVLLGHSMTRKLSILLFYFSCSRFHHSEFLPYLTTVSISNSCPNWSRWCFSIITSYSHLLSWNRLSYRLDRLIKDNTSISWRNMRWALAPNEFWFNNVLNGTYRKEYTLELQFSMEKRHTHEWEHRMQDKNTLLKKFLFFSCSIVDGFLDGVHELTMHMKIRRD